MSTPNAQAGAISFAHLAGITTPVHAAKADLPEDDKKDAKKAEDDTDDESMEDGQDEKKAEADDMDDEKAEDDKPDEADEDKKSKKARSQSGVSRGAAQERARWATVLGSKAFARNAAMGAHLLAHTDMTASAVLSVLRDAPASSATSDAARSARNPNLGVSAPAAAPSTDARWGAAFKRAGIA